MRLVLPATGCADLSTHLPESYKEALAGLGHRWSGQHLTLQGCALKNSSHCVAKAPSPSALSTALLNFTHKTKVKVKITKDLKMAPQSTSSSTGPCTLHRE